MASGAPGDRTYTDIVQYGLDGPYPTIAPIVREIIALGGSPVLVSALISTTESRLREFGYFVDDRLLPRVRASQLRELERALEDERDRLASAAT